MRMTTVIAALRSWVKRFWPGARKPTSRTSPNAPKPLSEPLPTTPNDAGSDPEHPLAGDIPQEPPGKRDRTSDDQPASQDRDDDRRLTEPSATSADPPSDFAPPETNGPPLSSSDADDQLPPSSAEVEPDEAFTAALPTDDEGQHSPPTGEHPDNGHPDCTAEGDTSAGNSRETKREPRQISGRRSRQPGNSGPERRQSASTRPELVCRRVSASATWGVILSADEECQLAAVHLEGEPLDFTARHCPVPSLRGRLTVSCQDGQERVIPLFEGDPLIFKLRKNWAGEGRRIARITSGHFIVVAPKTWQRTGRAPVEPDGCADPAFRAHYFHRDAATSDESVDGFREWNDSRVATGIELIGLRVFDDSDDGMLFVGDAPTLESSPETEWARVGEETEHNWGQNFLPGEQSLQEVLDGREGRFFLRVFDSEVSLLDSVAFRYVRDLRRIHVNAAEYAQDTVLVPTSTGYPPTEVRFSDADGSTLSPILLVSALQIVAPSGVIEVLPHPDADRISCSLGSGASAVNIVLDLPRIWWRLEDGRSDLGEWRDTPLVMTREEFRKHAHSNASMSVLSKRFGSVRAGFDHELDQSYSRIVEDNRNAIPLAHFVDHAQIDRRLNDDAHFNVEWAGEIVPLIVIFADPMPEIVSFTADPATVFAGQEAILEWTTRNAGDALVAIEPDVDVDDSDGTCTVRPTETTQYTLTLAVSGADDISRTVTVTVDSPPGPGERPAARVMSPVGGWRSGKGFSTGELQDAGLTVTEAVDHSIPIDRRRRTSHRANVEAIRSMLDG